MRTFTAAAASTAILGASLFVAPTGHTLPMPMPEVQSLPATPQTRDIVAETELYCLTLAVYFEGGSTFEPEIGQRHIARVITERAKAGRSYWGGKTICGVVLYKSKGVCQFSFACLPLARRTPKKNMLWEQSKAVAEDALAGRDEDSDSSIRYYMNAKLSALKNVCAFRKEFVPVVKAGTHEFFREATRAERAELAKTNPEACQRYAEFLKEQKRKAALAKAKKHKKSKLAKAKSRPGKAYRRTASR